MAAKKTKGKSRIKTKAKVAESRPPYRVRKNIAIDVAKLNRAREVLGVATETAAVDRALDSVVAGEEVIAAMERAFERGGFRGMRR
jgi:hypothetical protein